MIKLKRLMPLMVLLFTFPIIVGCVSVNSVQKEQLLKDNYLVAIHKTKVDKTQTGYALFSWGLIFLYLPHYDNDLRSLEITFQNLSSENITEIRFSVMPHDKDGNIAGNTTDGLTEKVVSYTNLVKANKTKTATWKSVWTNKNIAYVTIEAIEVKYSNGNIVHYDKEQIQNILVGSANNPRIKANSDKGFYMNTAVLYDYVKLSPDPKVESHGLGFSLGVGYDFGLATLGLDVDMDLLSLVTYAGYGYSNPSIDSFTNVGIGVNTGIKVYNGKIFDFIIPVGVMGRINTLEVTHDNKREFNYIYLAVASGSLLSWRLTDSLYLQIPTKIGYPFLKNQRFTNYPNKDFDALICSAGLNLKILF
ncbi:MAG: hypothetical protein LBB61_07830 [Treponema sp.]|jgi:hypothetical protein|nr:hypothetical protein [Treponema sp.]